MNLMHLLVSFRCRNVYLYIKVWVSVRVSRGLRACACKCKELTKSVLRNDYGNNINVFVSCVSMHIVNTVRLHVDANVRVLNV